MITRAKKKSNLIEKIDESWRDFVRDLKGSMFTVPFPGDYACIVKKNHMLIEGYSGLLFINRLYYNRKNYLLKTPIMYSPFKIYGVYDQRGCFTAFNSEPQMGFHYLGMNDRGHDICTGEIHYDNPESLGLLKEACLKIIKSLRVINLESLGTVILPERFLSLKNILADKNEDAKHKLEKLFHQNLIEEII
jgi:hypothetical protein